MIQKRKEEQLKPSKYGENGLIKEIQKCEHISSILYIKRYMLSD